MSDVVESKKQAIGNAQTNSTNVGSSTVKQEVDGETLAFLHTGTGEVVVVPPEQNGAFLTEARLMSDAVAQFHSANLAVQTLDDYKRANFNNRAECTKADAALEFALQWQDEAHQTYHDIFAGLDPLPDDASSKPAGTDSKPPAADAKKPGEDSLKLNGTAKKMIELVSLKKLSAEEREKKKAEDKKGKFDNDGYTKKLLSAKSVSHLKEHAKSPVTMPEKILYVRIEKIHWPKMKVLDNKGWEEVKDKDPKTGKKSMNSSKVGKYLSMKAPDSGVAWLKKTYKDNLEYGRSDTVGWWIFDVCESWNQQLKYDQNWKIDSDYIKSDIDLSANAQLMRYSYGVSLDPDLSFSDRKISVRAEGHAEINAAKGEAKLTLNFPRKEGWIWTYTGKSGEQKEIVAIVCQITATASALIGASIAAELSIEMATSEITEDAPKLKGKPGPKGRKVRRQNRAELKKDDKVKTTKLEAGAGVFIGAKADASLEGALQWRDPEDPKKDFVTIASISPAVGGMVGLSGELKLAIEYASGMFRLTAHASLCFGLGAEGVLTFSVSKDEVIAFFKCVFYKMAYAGFEHLGIIDNKTLGMLTKMQTLAALNQDSVVAYYGRTLRDVSRDLETQLASTTPQRLNEMAASAPELLAYALPETKGMLVCQMCKTQIASGDRSTLRETQKGVLSILKTAMLASELDNIIQHASPEGNKTSSDEVMAALDGLFKLGASQSASSAMQTALHDKTTAGSMDEIAYSGDFSGWYQAFAAQLIERLPRGYPVDSVDTVAYEVLRHSDDHPLFTSVGWNAYYQDEA